MYNEAAVLDAFFARLDRVLPAVAACDFEIVCVNDGSRDDTLMRLDAVMASRADVTVVDLTRNFGKEAALSAGLSVARGDAIIPMDADLQDPPEVIPELIEKWREGFEVVLAKRADRSSDSWAKRFSARSFYRVHNSVADVKIPDDVGDFRLMDRVVVDVLNSLPESRRFMKGLFAWVGFRTATVEYTRDARSAGETKFNAWKLWNFALEGIFSFSISPLRVWTYLGLFVALGAMGWGAWIALRTLVWGVDVPGYASLLVAILFLGGLQLVGIGMIGEYLGRAFIESKRRPAFLIRSVDRSGQATPPTSAGRFGGTSDVPRRSVDVATKTPSALEIRLQQWSAGKLACVFLLLAVIVQCPLFFLPGYFSHDDLQWLAYADGPVSSWDVGTLFADVRQFQYRPLTFTLWLSVNKLLGESPQWVHVVRATLGIANAGLLALLVARLGATRWVAMTAGLLCLMLPSSMYANAWIGTFADALCLLFALVLALWLTRPGREQWLPAAAVAFALTTAALLSKEAAIVFPALLGAVYVLYRRDPVMQAAVVGSAASAIIYLLLRLDVILFPAVRVDGYRWSLAHIPGRMFDYLVFPFSLNRFEAVAEMDRPLAWLAVVLAVLLLLAIWRVGSRWLAGLLAMFYLALAPALILPLAAVHYAYIAGAAALVVLAMAWGKLRRPGRVVLGICAIVVAIHGGQIARTMYRVAEVQQALYADLINAVATTSEPISIRAERATDEWIASRLLLAVPRYRGVQLGSRVRFVPAADRATMNSHWMTAQGRLRGASDGVVSQRK